MKFDIFTVTRNLPKSWQPKITKAIISIEHLLSKVPFIIAFECHWDSLRSRENGAYWWFPTFWFGRAKQLERKIYADQPHWRIYNIGLDFLGLFIGFGISFKTSEKESRCEM